MRDTVVDLTLASSSGRTPFLTYEPFYGLKEKPFSLSSDPRFLYKSRAHASVYDDLRAGIRRREGLIVLTGDIGTGKTTLCRSVLRDLDRKTFSTYVPDPFVSREDLLKMLLVDFGVMSVDDLKSGRFTGASKPELSYPLYEFLKSLVPLQAFAVLVIDEAQNLSLPLLEEIRILSDLEGPEKLLQVVMIGQLEFVPKLKDPQMRQFDQRVSVRCQLHALDRDAVADYIAHRLSVAGGGKDRVNFSEDAVDIIYKATNGNPRLINLVCDKALHHGHVTRTFSIGPAIVSQALREVGVTKLTPAPEPFAALRSLPETMPEFDAEPSQPLPLPDQDQQDQEDREIPSGRRRALRWIVAGLVGIAVGASLFFNWGGEPGTLAKALTAPRVPAALTGRSVTAQEPPAPPSETATAKPSIGAFEVGVALFSGATRATRLEAELIAAGYRAATWVVDFPSGRMFEVRTGPYATRDQAEADVARIRKMQGYADARVIPSPTARQ